MTSRCPARRLPLDSPQLVFDRPDHARGFAVSERDATDMRSIEAEFSSDTGEDVGAVSRDQNFLVERGIFEGHHLARRNMAHVSPRLYNRGNILSSEKEGVAEVPAGQWSESIGKLMKGQRLTQEAFAAKLNVTQATVSGWIAGKKEPRAEMYYRMAKLWPDATETPLLLKRAADISGAYQVAGFEKAAGSARRVPAKDRRAKFGRGDDEAVELPLLKDEAATGTPRQVQEKEIDRVLHFPSTLCPHPDKTVCIRARGDSMSPVLEDGYIVAIDTSEIDRMRLHDQMVAARDPEGGVTIKWLRKVGTDEMLLAQHTSRRYQPIVLSREPGWSVVGKVLWWIGVPP